MLGQRFRATIGAVGLCWLVCLGMVVGQNKPVPSPSQGGQTPPSTVAQPTTTPGGIPTGVQYAVPSYINGTSQSTFTRLPLNGMPVNGSFAIGATGSSTSYRPGPGFAPSAPIGQTFGPAVQPQAADWTRRWGTGYSPYVPVNSQSSMVPSVAGNATGYAVGQQPVQYVFIYPQQQAVISQPQQAVPQPQQSVAQNQTKVPVTPPETQTSPPQKIQPKTDLAKSELEQAPLKRLDPSLIVEW